MADLSANVKTSHRRYFKSYSHYVFVVEMCHVVTVSVFISALYVTPSVLVAICNVLSVQC